MTVNDLRKAMRGVSGDAVIVLSAHDAVTGKASFATQIEEQNIKDWNEDTGTNDFHENMFVISS